MGHSFLDQGLQFTGLVHLGDDIATPHQLAANVELRKCRPVRVYRKGSADIGIAQDVDIREAFAAGHETLHRLRRKPALRRLRRAFHIEQDRVALDLRLDRVDGFLAHPSLEYVDCIRALYMLQVLNIVLKRGDKHGLRWRELYRPRRALGGGRRTQRRREDHAVRTHSPAADAGGRGHRPIPAVGAWQRSIST